MSDLIQDYTKEIEKEASSGVATEHSYRPALKKLIEALEKGFPKFTASTLGRVQINPTQYFDGVPSKAWNCTVGGYQTEARSADAPQLNHRRVNARWKQLVSKEG